MQYSCSAVGLKIDRAGQACISGIVIATTSITADFPIGSIINAYKRRLSAAPETVPNGTGDNIGIGRVPRSGSAARVWIRRSSRIQCFISRVPSLVSINCRSRADAVKKTVNPDGIISDNSEITYPSARAWCTSASGRTTRTGG